MNSGAKVFLVVVVLLAVFFMIGLGMSVHHKDDNTNRSRDNFHPADHAWLDGLHNTFSGRGPEIDPSGNGCLSYNNNRLRIRASFPCILNVPPAKPLLGIIPPPTYRNVKFKVVTGAISFKALAEDRLNRDPDSDSTRTWNPNAEALLSVDQNGGRLVLRCDGPVACEVKFE